MPTTTYTTIRAAILAKQRIFATYDGIAREICPHAIGTKGGVEQVICYQFGGRTSRGAITSDTKDNWKCMTVSKFRDVTVSDGEWHTFDNHGTPSTCIDLIDVKVDY